jgi:hypothetical protein
LPNLVPAGAFCFVHRDVGGLHEAFNEMPVTIVTSRCQPNATDTQAGCHFPGGGGDCQTRRLGGAKCFLDPDILRDQEFFSANTSDHRSSSADPLQVVGYRRQDAIAGSVAVSVVYTLEVIEIDHQNTETRRAATLSVNLG